MRKEKALLFEMGEPGRRGSSLPSLDVPKKPLEELLPPEMQRQSPLNLPELSEGEVMRHYTELSTRNFGVDSGFYPLGSCTMKYNPKINEEMAALPGFTFIHPLQEDTTVQGALELLYLVEQELKEVTGMDRISFQPAAGAHGELTGLMIMLAYHRSRGEKRRKVLVPDSAHGTNPATITMAGCQAVEIPSDERGQVDLEALENNLDDDTAGLMLTNPNTLGLFEEDIGRIARSVHKAGGLLYYDGANLNAVMGYARPGDMGFDIVHLNLHKTFSTPHGAGGPGSGSVGVCEKLASFLPYPLVDKKEHDSGDNSAADGKEEGKKKGKEEGKEKEKKTVTYYWNYNLPDSIGKIHSFHGNFSVAVKTYTYLRTMGAAGLKQVSRDAVLNANYLMQRLKKSYHIRYERTCKHEFVVSARNLKKNYGVGTADVAKCLLDYGFHPPTVYFPIIVEEPLMIEPTETESKKTLDRFAEAMEDIARRAEKEPETVTSAPHTTVVARLDEVTAARHPRVCWKPSQEEKQE